MHSIPQSNHNNLLSSQSLFKSYRLILNNIIIKIFTLLSFIFNLLLFVSCLSEPEYEVLYLQLEDVSCIEAWLKIEGKEGSEISLKRDNIIMKEFTLTQSDTTVVDNGLFPNTTYQYQVFPKNCDGCIASEPVSVTTMDTTSHNFTWQIYEFGEHSSSFLNDVAIINPDNIWCIGEIYINDSEGNPDVKRYNAIHWNGRNWEIIRIPYLYQNQNIINPLNFVFVLNEQTIYFGGNGIVKWNGKEFENFDINDESWGSSVINEMWGNSNENLYIVGNDGELAHYNGQNWHKIESRTYAHIQDIWGIYNSNYYDILCPVSTMGEEIKLLKINMDNNVIDIEWPYKDKYILSLWFKDLNNVFICGFGVYKSLKLERFRQFNSLPNLKFNKIRGNNTNDVFVAGDFGFLAHYNGIDWKEYTSFARGNKFISIDYKDDKAVAVGYNDNMAIIFELLKVD